MTLLLKRHTLSPKSTLGVLFVDGVQECWTLEDVVRKEKVFGETAIPAGDYRVVINLSGRFHRLMPQLLDVPGFSGIRIHAGNTAANTEGCILVGTTQSADFVGGSRKAFDKLFAKLTEAILLKEDIHIQITNPNPKELEDGQSYSTN